MGRAVHPHIITPDSALGGKDIARSLRFDHNANCFLTRTPSSTGNKRTWTFSVWMKHCLITSGRANTFFCSGTNNPDTIIKIDNDRFEISRYGGGYQVRVTSTAKLRDPGSWYHLVGAVDTTQATASNRVKLYINGNLVTDFDNSSYPSQDYEFPEMNNSGTPNYIGRHGHPTSQNFDGYMAEFNFIDGAQLTPDNFGFTDPLTGIWKPKKFKFTSDIPNKITRTYSGTFTASGNGFGSLPTTNAFNGDLSNQFNNSAGGQIITWNTSTYNLSGNVRIYGRGSAYDVYINGNATKVADMPSSNGWVDLGTHDKINEIQWAGTTYNTNNGLGSAGVHVYAFIVGGVWLRDNFSEFGTNGFYLDFSDNSGATATTIGKDRSGNNNNYAPTNISVSAGNNNDSAIDSPIDNFVTLNPLRTQNDNCILSNGNLKATGSNESYPGATGNVALSSGKWYYEFEINNKAGSGHPLCGICQNDYIGGGPDRICYTAGGGYISAAPTEPQDPDSFAVGDIIGVAIDLDDAAGNIRFYKNGTLQPVLDILNAVKAHLQIEAKGGVFPYVQMYTNDVCTVNFGQTPFIHTPPTGFRALSYKNLTTPTGNSIVNPKKHFDTLLYTTGSSNGTFTHTGVGFRPDLMWIKCRSAGEHNYIVDSVRGDQAVTNKFLRVSDSSSEGSTGIHGTTWTTIDGGFKVTETSIDNSNGGGEIYYASRNYAVWCWKAGGSSNTFNVDGKGYASASAAGITNGTIALTHASVNREAGFSILRYTGGGSAGTIGHGLGKVPKWIITKRLSNTEDWKVYHPSITGGHFKKLNNGPQGEVSNTNVYPDTDPTTTVYSVGSHDSVSGNSDNYVAYCWAEIPGYSKFGDYLGNNSADGTYVHTGFRPAWIMVKLINNDNWYISDNKRDPFNVNDHRLFADSNAAEGGIDQEHVDFLSNGFKFRRAKTPFNSNGVKHIYMAFAEQPGSTPYMAPSNPR